MRNPLSTNCHFSNRRRFCADLGLGFAGLALGAMLHRDGFASPSASHVPDGKPHFPPKAKSVIWLFMNGGISQMESFDPKPMLQKYAGKSIFATPYTDVLDPKKLELRGIPSRPSNESFLLPPQIGFKKHGQSGIEVSDVFPHIARNIDKITVVRSMWTTDRTHEAQIQFHTGRPVIDIRNRSPPFQHLSKTGAAAPAVCC